MKKLCTLLIPVLAVVFVILMAGFGGGENTDYPVGAPPGYTNSPGDGQNCSHCMGGTAVPVADWIATDIPGTGYLPGMTYNIVVTVTGEGDKGFELSPQNIDGDLIGTLIAGPENKLVGAGKYVTHSLAALENPMSWSFQWTAPATGVGTVTFYACAAVGKLNTKILMLTVPQGSLGVSEEKTFPVFIYPNPVVDNLYVSCSPGTSARVEINLLSVSGGMLSTLYQGTWSAIEQPMAFPVDLNAGIYLLKIQTDGKQVVRKIVVQ